jgi:hypothetical protein
MLMGTQLAARTEVPLPASGPTPVRQSPKLPQAASQTDTPHDAAGRVRGDGAGVQASAGALGSICTEQSSGRVHSENQE